MSGLLPSDREEVTEESAGDVRVLEIDDADHLIESLSSETARAVLSALHQDTATASELADTVDTSLQNVRHHLDTLIEADLVRVVDTQYSVKGREMDVYGPVEDALVVCVGGDSETDSLVDQLSELVGATALLAVASIVVQYGFETAVTGVSGPESSPRVADSISTAEPLFGVLPPGVAFFAGGLLVLFALFAWSNRDAVPG